jgi:hypothetical protein
MSESKEPTVEVGAQFLQHIQRILLGLQQGDIPFSDELTPLRQQIEERLTSVNAAHLMEARYRCTQCFHEWTLYNDLADARDCPECDTAGVEPYTVLDGSSNDAPLYALAELEKRHPNPAAQGTYVTEVVRTAYQIRELAVEAVGPGAAEWAAITKAPGKNFSSDVSADYEVTNVQRVGG